MIIKQGEGEKKSSYQYFYEFLLLYLKSSIVSLIILYIVNRYNLSTGHWFLDYFITFTLAFTFVKIADYFYPIG